MDSLVQGKLKFTFVLEDVVSNKDTGDCGFDSRGGLNKSDCKKM